MSDSEIKKAMKALRWENEKLEADKIRQDKEIVELLKKVKNVWTWIYCQIQMFINV